MLGGIPNMANRFGMGGTQQQPQGSFDQVSSGGGMDVMGSLQKHSNFATQFQSDPTGGMQQQNPLWGFAAGGF